MDPRTGELVPVEDRLRWMLLTRAALSIAVLVVWQATTATRGSGGLWLAGTLGWVAITAFSPFAVSIGRRATRAALTITLLGDGVLLAFGWWATGALNGPLGYLVILHAVAVTMLASFRTGVKLAVWHSVIGMLFLEASAEGLLGQVTPVPLVRFWLYLGALWLAVLGTASFAAMNERELRRRRYDSEVLREFGLAVGAAPGASAVAVALARFADAELGARRTAVLAYVRDGDDGPLRGLGAVAAGDGAPVVHELQGEPPEDSALRTASGRTAALLRARLHPTTDRWLADLLPAARNVVIVPFSLQNVIGALVLESGTARWGASAQRRVERRVVNTAEQATAQAAVALERAVLTDRIRAASETDGLTRVANRRRFDEVLRDELARARETGAAVSLVMIDIDYFKRLNDTYGHLVGDEVLRQVAQAIRADCPEPHVVARYGGEEFAAILVGADAAAAVTMAERIRASIGAAPTVTPVTASLGVAACPAHGEHPANLLAAADAALYRAKTSGRNRVVTAEATPSSDGRAAALSPRDAAVC
ncbi:MAG TPA: GGDEF domain-containing protein [Pilimelia sp.]|nr:GGDEF domain-containing protein [Pilimelia sp.]